MSKILVTGGGGFIGSNIVKKLLNENHNVRVMDNFATGRRENLEPFINDIELIEGDIRSYHIVKDAVKGMDYILHQAALPSVPRSINDPLTTNEVNIVGTLNLLQAARDEGVERFVFASSSSIYGDSETLPKVETMNPNPKSPYAISKLTGEFYCKNFYKLYGLPTIMLRYFNVFGPNQDPNSQYSAVIPRFISRINTGRTITVFGDGEQTRDFTYVDNVVEGNKLALEAPDKAFGNIYNIACNETTSLNDLITYMEDIIGKQAEKAYAEPRQGDVKHSYADIDKISTDMQYKPIVSVKDGLKNTVKHFCNK